MRKLRRQMRVSTRSTWHTLAALLDRTIGPHIQIKTLGSYLLKVRTFCLRNLLPSSLIVRIEVNHRRLLDDAATQRELDVDVLIDT